MRLSEAFATRLGVIPIRFTAQGGTRDSAARYGGMAVTQIKASSAVERVGYNDETENLSIWFKGGRRYVYSGVPRRLYDELCLASSAGRFVNTAIKGRFPCRSEPPRRCYPA